MYCVNIEENFRHWYRLTRHLNYNSSEPYTCFINPSNFVESTSQPCQIALHVSESEDGEPVTNYAIAQSSCDVPEENLFISPTLLYNRIVRHNPMIEDVYVSIEFTVSEDDSAGIESIPEIHFSLIRSTDYHVEMDFSYSMKMYFTENRIYLDSHASQGDVILMNLSELDKRRHFSEYGTRPESILVKFEKVIKRSDVQRLCFIDSEETRVELVGFQRDFVPLLSFSSKLDEDPIDLSRDNFKRASQAVNFIIDHWKYPDKTNYGLLLCGKSGFGQVHLIQRLARRFSLNIVSLHVHDVAAIIYSSSSTLLHSALSNTHSLSPCLVVLHDLDRMVRSREMGGRPDPELCDAVVDVWISLKKKSREFPVIVVATIHSGVVAVSDAGRNSIVDSTVNLPPQLLKLFIERLNFQPPDRSQREVLINSMCERRYLSFSTRIFHYLSQRTAGFSFSQLGLLVDKLSDRNEGKVLTDGVCDQVLEEVFKLTGRRFRPADIPKVAWQDIGGLKDVIDDIVSAVQLTGAGMGAGGILLYGPPGTGKTMLAKAVAKECNMNFLSVKGPELLNMYVGQSEANVRDLFRRAREASPCIIFCDELDSLAPKRGRAGDSGGVMDRVVSQLMSEMEASTEKSPVQVIGATNRPDLLDDALLRPGRFDRLIYVGVSKSRTSHEAIFLAQTRKFPLPASGEDGSLDVGQIIDVLPKHLTGADMYAMCTEAWRIAISRHIDNIKTNDDNEVNSTFCVQHEDFLVAARNLIPSVSETELRRYEDIKAQIYQ